MTDIYERTRLASIAVAETVPGVSAHVDVINGEESTMWFGHTYATRPLLRKAGLLADMALEGPETEVVCWAHIDPDHWDDCGMISAASALLGRTCWKAQR